MRKKSFRSSKIAVMVIFALAVTQDAVYAQASAQTNSGPASSPRPASSPQAQQWAAGVRQGGIDELVLAAISTHPSIAAKRADMAGAEADVQTARWQYFPTLSVGTSRDDDDRTAVTVAVQQPLWTGGRLDASHDAAKARAWAAETSVLEARHNLAINVASAYQTWLQFAERTDVLNRAVQFHEEQAKSIRRRVETGVTAAVDLELLRSRLAQVRADVAASQSSMNIALSRLSQLVGRPLASADVARTSPEHVEGTSIPKTLEAMLDVAAAKSPALRRLEADVEAALHDVRLRHAAVWPTVSVRAERTRNDNLAATTGSRNDSRVMLTVDFSPGAGLSAFSAMDAAQAKALSLKESRETAYRELVDRVSADYEELQSAKARRIELIRTRKAADDILASYSRQFVEAGKRSWLDVMNAARERTQVESSLADVDAQIVAADYRLRLYAGQPEWYVAERTDQ